MNEPIEDQINSGLSTIIHDENIMLVLIIILLLLLLLPSLKKLFLFITKCVKKFSTPLLNVETRNESDESDDGDKIRVVTLNEITRRFDRIEDNILSISKRMDLAKEERNIQLRQLTDINTKISETQMLDSNQNNKIDEMWKSIKRNRYVTMETLCQIKIFMKDLAVKERLDAGYIYTKKLKKNGHSKKLVSRLERAYNEYTGDDKDLFTVDF